MKGFYLTAEQINLKNPDLTSGITKKIIWQANTLNEFLGCELIVMEHRPRKMPRLISAIWTRLPFTGISNCWFFQDRFREAQFIYIRRENVDQSFVRFLKKIKKENKNVKLLLELPNYPYNLGKGRYGKYGYPYYLKNKNGVKHFYKYIDRIVTYSDHKEIFGIKTINIDNGISLKNYGKRNITFLPRNGEIHLIGVAQVRMWHGYDRLVEGLYNYYKQGGKRKITFDIVGDILDSYDYTEKIKEYHLENNIILHGKKSGEELDTLYNQANMGVDAFATHRTGGQQKSSSLKTREYFAKGLPFITSICISDVPFNYPYVKYFSQGEDPIDIYEIIEFYDSIYQNKEDYYKVNDEIRNYAEKNMDWSKKFLPVIKYIEE